MDTKLVEDKDKTGTGEVLRLQYCRVPKNGGQTVPAWIVLIFHDFSQSRSYFTIRLRVM